MAIIANSGDYRPEREVVTGGTLAGLIGGVTMALFTMTISFVVGQGFWTPMYLIGGLFWGVDTLIAGGEAAFVGFLTHMAVSAFCGGIFALFVKRHTSTGRAFWRGLAYGAVVWAVMSYFVLPWSDPMMSVRIAVMPGWWFAGHLVFGAMLFLTPILARALSSRREKLPQERRLIDRVA